MMSYPPSTEPMNITTLTTMVSDLVEAIKGMISLNASATSSPVQAATSVPLLNSCFVPSLTFLASNGMSPPFIRSLFPKVEAAIIIAIITHKFKATDLHKLDYKFEASNMTMKEYKTPNSILIPLQTYFSILQVHITDQHANITLHFFTYNVHLLKLASEYEWVTVLDYYVEFFNMQHTKMMDGIYSGWGMVDVALIAEHILEYCKQATSKLLKSTTP
ncbi:hypothetical protein H0H87_007045 [Tephrocybe sp. NHM501043]|nr:hypothetical protein H0H87_007045 [Tephrocybe sp. NHM501043]